MNSFYSILKAHSLVILLTAGTLLSFGWLMRYRDRLRLKWYAACLIAVIHTFWGVLAVLLFAPMETGFQKDSFGNMSLFGAVCFMPVFYWLLAKLLKTEKREIFDVCTGCTLLTLLCARINCIISGCCYGRYCAALGIRYPTRQAEILYYIVMLTVFAGVLKDRKKSGMIWPLYMVSYGAFRFLTEGFRHYETDSLIHRAHIWALITLFMGYSIYVEIKKTNEKTERKRKKWEKQKGH